jgi:hypothetical protein
MLALFFLFLHTVTQTCVGICAPSLTNKELKSGRVKRHGQDYTRGLHESSFMMPRPTTEDHFTSLKTASICTVTLRTLLRHKFSVKAKRAAAEVLFCFP